MKEENAGSVAVALFKYGIISPVLYENVAGQNKYFEEAAEKFYEIPDGRRKKFTVSAFKRWLKIYRVKEFAGLIKKPRIDKGRHKKIPADIIPKIITILSSNPAISTATSLYKMLIKAGLIQKNDFTEQTLRKLIKNQNLFDMSMPVPRKKYEMEHINQLWVADFTELRIMTPSGKKTKRIYLCAIMDDYSRVIVGYNWSDNENISSLIKALKMAVKRFGIPQRFYCDNGSSFISKAFIEITARLKIALIHSKPYDPPSRGKIERFFETLKSMFVPTIYNNKLSADELSKLFTEWLETEYHRRHHKGIDNIPMNKYLDDINNIPIEKLPDDKIEQCFFTSVNRKVRSDSIISFNNCLYEVDPKYIGQLLEIKFQPDNPEILFISDDGVLKKLSKVDPHLNANPPHVSISYSKLIKSEEL